MGRNATRSQIRLLLLSILVVALLAAFGSTASANQAVSAGSTSAAATPKPASKAAWKKLVAAAKKEGSVTIYTTQNPVLLADMAAKFKEKYGISVTINRNIDSVLATQVTAEEGSGKAIADIWVCASKPLVLGALKNGWVVDAVGPDLFSKAFDRKIFAKPGKAFVVGEAILGVAWNTSQFPGSVSDLPDVLKAPSGRIGVISPSAPSIVDWYLWVEETYGKSFLQKLAALKPKKYPSSLPMGAAVVSGELAVGTFVPPTVLDQKAQGAPVNFKLPKGAKTWNAPYYGMVLKQAPHSAAAQVLANYMITKEGQSTSQRAAGTVRKDVSNAYYVTPRQQNLKALTPAKVSAYQAYWNDLFK
ncbi:MAG TPA: extracellular solute-binding protein [Gaiellaceae bacterium]